MEVQAKLNRHTPVVLNRVRKCIAETSAPGWVGRNDDISLICKDFGVPSCAPGIGPGTLRTTMDVKEQWVGLALIKIWRVYEKRLDLAVSVKNARIVSAGKLRVYICPVALVIKLINISSAESL